MLAIVRIALHRPYTFVVVALLILIVGTLSALRMPVDIFPSINIPIIGVAFQYQGLPPDQANARAYSLLNRIILGQASTLAYIDIISIMAVLVLLLAPCAFLMKRPQKGAAPAAAH